MGVSLEKGQKVSLKKMAPGLTKAVIGLGWKERATAGVKFDLDASVFLLGENGKVTCENDFIYYHELEHDSGCIVHDGDNRTGGDGSSDQETINLDLTKIPENIKKIAIVVTIDEAVARRQTFGQVSDAYVRLVNAEDSVEVLRFDLSEDYSVETAVAFAELYLHNGEWKFSANGQGLKDGLAWFVTEYGLEVE